MKRYTTAATVNGLAILALMSYSLDRTSWLFGVFETGREGASTYGMLAAIVIEVAAVALIVGDATIGSKWAGWGLATILATQGVANFIAGYIRGADAILKAIGGGQPTSVFWIAAVALALTNFSVPFLIFVLSKLEADIVKQAIAHRATSAPVVVDEGAQPSITTMPPAQLPAPDVDALVAPDIVRWKDVDKLSFQAIGERLGISRQAAQKRYEKAKASVH
jgi:hypothetical protein